MDSKICNHRCIAIYIKNEFVVNVFSILFTSCYFAIRLDFAPSFVFIRTYMQSEGSRYFIIELFGDLSSFLIDCLQIKLTPVIGSDIQ